MKQKSLARWLKAVLLGLALCGGVLYVLVLPAIGQEEVLLYPEFAHCFWPWLGFLWASGVPCYGVLILAWQIAGDIGRDRSFTPANARRLQWIAWLAAGDSLFFFGMNLLYGLLGMNHPGVLLGSLVVEFAGVCVAVAAGVLSHLVGKAAALQEQSDLTV